MKVTLSSAAEGPAELAAKAAALAAACLASLAACWASSYAIQRQRYCWMLQLIL